MNHRTITALLLAVALAAGCSETPPSAQASGPVPARRVLAAAAADFDGDGVPAAEDCDDEDPDVYPGKPEDCDGKDNDCNGLVDEPCADPPGAARPCRDGGCEAWAPDDADHDGVPADEDCDDSDREVYPGRPEDCDGKDNDCNGGVDEPCIDANLDLADRPAADEDRDPERTPELLAGDADGDGHVGPDDCDEGDGEVYLGRPEDCDRKDNDCDGETDEVCADP